MRISEMGMTREEAKAELLNPDYLARYVADNLTRSPKAGVGMFNCPFCGSGTHKNKTGAFHINNEARQKWRCESCGERGDLFDLIGHIEGMPGKENFARQLDRAAEIFGVEIRRAADSLFPAAGYQQRQIDAPQAVEQEEPTENAEPLHTFADFYEMAHRGLGKTDYWQRRGLTRETAERFCLGYVPNWTPPGKPNVPETPRLIVPISPHAYLARDIRPKAEIPDYQRQDYTKQKIKQEGAGAVCWTFNAARLQTATSPIFIVEGEIDAMSIEQEGGAAIGLGGTTHVNSFFRLLDGLIADGHKPEQPFIIALDNDEPGQKAAGELAAGLTARGILFSRPSGIWGDSKDANEALTDSPATLKAAIADAPMLIAEEAQRRVEIEELSKLPPAIREGAAALNGLQPITMARITELAKQRGKGFDFQWTFYNERGEAHSVTAQGLTIIAARTGGGKTFSLANLAARALIVDPSAQVLFLSLEEAEESVFYRVLTAYIAQNATEKCLSVGRTPTVSQTRAALEASGEGWKNSPISFSREKWDVLEAGMQEITPRLLVADLFNTPDLRNVDFAFGLIWEFFSLYKEKAVIFLDYIQLLQPNGTRTNDYREIKSIMSRLKKLVAARVNLIAGAQLNRDAATRYTNPAEEFLQTIPEQIREGADIEQAAELILFCKSSKEVVLGEGGIMGQAEGERYYMNYRTLKNRRGANDLTMSMPCDFSRALDFSQQLKCDLLSSEAAVENTTKPKKGRAK